MNLRNLVYYLLLQSVYSFLSRSLCNSRFRSFQSKSLKTFMKKEDSCGSSQKSIFANIVISLSLLFGSFDGSNSAWAADTVKIGKCLLTSCQKELAQCILNPKCFANVICLNTCNNRPDESECQVNLDNISIKMFLE